MPLYIYERTTDLFPSFFNAVIIVGSNLEIRRQFPRIIAGPVN